MKVRLYIPEKSYNRLVTQNILIGKDNSGLPYYVIDVEHISPHEEFSREVIESITWNNVDVKNEPNFKEAKLDEGVHTYVECSVCKKPRRASKVCPHCGDGK